MEYYSVLRKKKKLSYATMWMNLENIMQSEICQSQKDKLNDSTYMRYDK